jgi:hypothetical protein
MFDSITVKRNADSFSDSPLDVGSLLEALIYYRTTKVVVDHNTLRPLIERIGIYNLEKLVGEGFLGIQYTCEGEAAIQGSTPQGDAAFAFAHIGAEKYQLDVVAERHAREILGDRGKARWAAQKIQKIATNIERSTAATQNAKHLILDQAFLARAMQLVIGKEFPFISNHEGEVFKTEDTEQGCTIKTSFLLEEANRFKKSIDSSAAEVSYSKLFLRIFEAETDLYFAAVNGTEIATTELSSKLIGARFTGMIERSQQSSDERADFENRLVPGRRAIGEAFNSGVLSIDEIMDAIVASSKFKQWSGGLSSDASMISEYINECTKDTVADHISTNVGKWIVVGALADQCQTVFPFLGSAVGLGFAAVEHFFVERVVKGWRPHQFVNERLKPLLAKTR